MNQTFADRVINFNDQLHFKGSLPPGIQIMNPFREDPEIGSLAASFYQKYYADTRKRYLILGINPGRFGGGVTGIPFTDSKRLVDKCQLSYHNKVTHETSSVFIYDMIDAYGGVEEFYGKFYINSVCPLGFTATGAKGTPVNYNYYDQKELTAAVREFMIESIEKQLQFGIYTETCFCFGTGKNENFLRKLNDEKKYFKELVALEHPRFIMQYKSKSRQLYIDKYVSAFNSVPHR